ncbi:hypothetical protein VOLCADRAFT_92265 [Volvox carteri f. nagariensis]|uniref:UDENN domain-containing protein n=1 Tax=Volvox carteri f. nagariensis TaxID=3068 RepID=D8TZ73_VOLCA|nr:uncharacterized protein VOLCADRAFT_92265 [Volvox carteri f. nagariensis]EFJ47225.1 hypothetical protein VOLCADRAFT_92265 [Volvox carteri f. nagariensis]|eukprot:XP_002951774.1 hypothetical protein VOLCADRAFT_92265 [Volvox carteri f. nagariensis]
MPQPTRAAEGLLQLLWPIRYRHVYVPLVPASLVDLLDAPTPFIMGLGGRLGAGFAAEVAAAAAAAGGGGAGGGFGGDGAAAVRAYEAGVVVVDLDRDWVCSCADLERCLDHPAVRQLLTCLAALRLEPGGSGGGGGRASFGCTEADPWMPYVRTAASRDWGSGHDALVRRLFLRLFASLLRVGLPRASARLVFVSPGGCTFHTESFLKAHCQLHGPQARSLPEQLVQTQGFYMLLDEYGSKDPYGWYRTASTACREELVAVGLSDVSDRGRQPPGGTIAVQRQCQQQRGLDAAALGADGAAAAATTAVTAAAAAAATPLILIGKPAEEEGDGDGGGDGAAAPPPAPPPPQLVQSYCRPCPLLRRRNAPTYSEIGFHTSVAAAAAAPTAAATALLQGWQRYILHPPDAAASAAAATVAAADAAAGRYVAADAAACGGGRPVGGDAVSGAVVVVGGGGGAVADPSSRKRALTGNRRNRSLSGSLSGDVAAALTSELAKPRYRISSCEVPTPAVGAANAAAADGGGGGGARPASATSTSSPTMSELPSTLKSAAAAVAAEASSISASFTNTLSSISHSLRVGRKASPTAAAVAAAAGRTGAVPAGGAGGGGPAAASTAGHVLGPVPHGHGHGHHCAANHHNHHNHRHVDHNHNHHNHHHIKNHQHGAHAHLAAAGYAAEQDLVRQQVTALTQLLSWGEPSPSPLPPPPPQHQRQASRGGLLPPPASPAAAAPPPLPPPSPTAAAAASLATAATAGACPVSKGRRGGVPELDTVERVRSLLRLQTSPPGEDSPTAAAAKRERPPGCHGVCAGSGGGSGGGRRLQPAAYSVLTDVFDELVNAAVQEDDFGILIDALELSTRLYTMAGAVHEAAPSGVPVGAEITGGHASGGGGGGGSCTAHPMSRESLRRQRVFLKGVQRILSSLATWLSYLGVAEEAAWELLSGLVTASGVRQLTGMASREDDHPDHVEREGRTARSRVQPLSAGPWDYRPLGTAAAMAVPYSRQHHWPVAGGYRPALPAAPYEPLSRSLSAAADWAAIVPPPPMSPAMAATVTVATPQRRQDGLTVGQLQPRRRRRGGLLESSPPPPSPLQQQPYCEALGGLSPSRSLSDAQRGGRGGMGGVGGADPRVGRPAPPLTPPFAAAVAAAAVAAAACTGDGTFEGLAGITSPLSMAFSSASPSAKRRPASGTSPGPLSPNANVAAGGGGGYVGGGGGSRLRSTTGGGASRAYSAKYERQLAAAAAAAAASPSRPSFTSLGGKPQGRSLGPSGPRQQQQQQQAPPPPQQQQQRRYDTESHRTGLPYDRRRMASAPGGITGGEGPAAAATCALAVGSGGPIVALAAASGVVLAGPLERSCFVLTYQQYGTGLQVSAKMPLCHLDGAYADRLDITPDGCTAAMSVAPLPPLPPLPPPPWGASSAATAAATGGDGLGCGPRSRVLGLVDVGAGRIVRELRPGMWGGESGRGSVRHCRTPTAVLTGHGAAVTALHVHHHHKSFNPTAVNAAAAGGVSGGVEDVTGGAVIYSGALDGSIGAWTADGRCLQLLPSRHRGAVTLLAAASAPTPTPARSPLLGTAGFTSTHPPAASVTGAPGTPAAPAERLSSATAVSGGGFEQATSRGDYYDRLSLVTSAADGSAGLWALTRGSLGYSPLLDWSETGSLARVAAWDAARGVLLRGDERGVVRTWAPGM